MTCASCNAPTKDLILLRKIECKCLCQKCKDTGELENGDFCQDCCEHHETDHGICVDCGVDCIDTLISKVDFYD